MRYLLLSPVSNFLCLAAHMRAEWDHLRVAGRKRVVQVLEELRDAGEVSSVLLLLPRVSDPPRVNALLRDLTRAGARVQWFAEKSSSEVSEACREIESVRLRLGATVQQAVEYEFGPLARHLSGVNPEREDFLQYHLNVALMSLPDSTRLEEAVKWLAEAKTATFRCQDGDKASIELFKRLEAPYLEGHSLRTQELKQRIRTVGKSELTVLILGESGTGKEAAAFYIHDFSLRRKGPFVAVNCAGLEEGFLRSELFGHRKGSFTGAIGNKVGLVEAAQGGTLFLDEIGEMPAAVQADLLRFLQSKTYRALGSTDERRADVRIVAAAQPGQVERIRPDLYWRVAEVVVRTPALREVPDDLLRFVRHIAYRTDAASLEREHAIQYFTKRQHILRSRQWPGNMRELRSLVRRRLVLGDDVLSEANAAGLSAPLASAAETSGDPVPTVKEMQMDYVRRVWARRGAKSQQEVARELDISVNTLKSWLRTSVRRLI